jgi:glyoxylase-like metal-dependent hydrolase (beta-lactamase superfamily II)
MFGVVPKLIWEKKYPADENNLGNFAIRSLLIDTGERRILIDNGYGDKQGKKYLKHVGLNGGDGLVGGLAKHGYTPDDITDMVLTHLHSDHCGGGVKWNNQHTGFELTFPNAIYWVSRQQWDWAINPNVREADSYLDENMLPMKDSGHLKFIRKDTRLCPDVNLRLFHGHTTGQIIPFINYQGRTVVFAADLIPTAAHIPVKYNMAYDVQPLVTLREKEAFTSEAVKNNYILFFQHDLYTECATLMDTEKGPRLKESFTLETLIKKG